MIQSPKVCFSTSKLIPTLTTGSPPSAYCALNRTEEGGTFATSLSDKWACRCQTNKRSTHHWQRHLTCHLFLHFSITATKINKFRHFQLHLPQNWVPFPSGKDFPSISFNTAP